MLLCVVYFNQPTAGWNQLSYFFSFFFHQLWVKKKKNGKMGKSTYFQGVYQHLDAIPKCWLKPKSWLTYILKLKFPGWHIWCLRQSKMWTHKWNSMLGVGRSWILLLLVFWELNLHWLCDRKVFQCYGQKSCAYCHWRNRLPWFCWSTSVRIFRLNQNRVTNLWNCNTKYNT